MKKIIVLISILFVTGLKAQDHDKFGVWSYAQFTNNNFSLFDGFYTNGGHGIIDVKNIRPYVAIGAPMDWTLFDNVVYDLANKQQYFGIQIQYGEGVPDSFRNGKATDGQKIWTMRGKTGTDTMKYPYYLHANYKAWFYSTLDSVIKHITDYPESVRKYFFYYHVAEGSTGDNEPYKGEPIKGSDTINFQKEWLPFRMAEWDSLKAKSLRYGFNIQWLINMGNDFGESDLILGVFPDAWTKEGTLSHDILFDGSKSYFERISPVSRGEWQGWVPDYSVNQNKEGFALVASAATGGLNMLDITQAYVNVMSAPYNAATKKGGANKEMLAFFNKYTNDSMRRAFIVPMDAIDFMDTDRFPESEYGELVRTGCPCDSKGKDSATKLATTLFKLEESGMPQGFKDYKRATTIAKYLKWDRVLAIRNQFPQLGFVKESLDVDGNFNSYVAGVPANNFYDDFGVNVANFEKNATLLARGTTITGLARIGADTTMLGRFAAKGQFLIDLDNGMSSNKQWDTLQIKVSYYDSTTTGTPTNMTLSIPNTCGTTTIKLIPVGNTKTWKSTSITVAMKLRPNSWDAELETAGVAVGLLEFEMMNK